jgi:molybdopterin molybdotransferase
MTGAPLPDGSDTVVPLEGTEQREGQIKLIAAPFSGAYVRQQGEDFHCGDLMLVEGAQIDAGAIGLLAAAGVKTLKVYPCPRVAVLATGDELVGLDEKTRPNTIIGSNIYMLAERLREEGIEPLLLGIAQDHSRSLEDQVARGLCADLLITTGGVSTGDRDLVKDTLSQFGFAEGFSKVAIRPGKSILFGTVDDVPVFGLPGNPNAAAVTFELFVRPALRCLSGYHTPLAPRLKTILADKISGGRKYQQFLWGRLEVVAGKLHFYPTRQKKMGLLHDLPGAEALLPVAEESPGLVAGSEVEVIMLRLPGGEANRLGDDRIQKY